MQEQGKEKCVSDFGRKYNGMSRLGTCRRGQEDDILKWSFIKWGKRIWKYYCGENGAHLRKYKL